MANKKNPQGINKKFLHNFVENLQSYKKNVYSTQLDITQVRNLASKLKKEQI